MNDVVNKIDNRKAGLTLFQQLERGRAWFEPVLLNALKSGPGSNLNRADIHLLANLNCGPTYASELARRLGVTRQATTKLLKNLIAADLVRLEPDPERRNTKRIVLTKAGKNATNHAVAELEQAERDLAERIGRDQAEALRAVLSLDWGTPPRLN